MSDLRGTIELIEELAANAWPAPVQQQLGPWRLRAGNGVTRRANSVLAVGAMPAYEPWLEEVADFYARRGLPVRFHISDGSPGGLDEMLDGMGYVSDAYSSVQVAGCDAVLARAGGIEQYDTVPAGRLGEQWLDSCLRREEFPESSGDTYRRIV